MIKVLFIPDLKTVEVEAGTSVIRAAEKAGVLIDASCNGNGTCGKCIVKIDGAKVLACQTEIDRDIEIVIPATHGGSGRKKKMVKLPENFEPDCNAANTVGEARTAAGDCYGVAFDIGTTTVVGMLWNLASGELVDVESRTNYQTLYGADVISRIQYSIMGEREAKRAGSACNEKLKAMQSKVMQCCNDILEEICERNSIDSRDICDATAVGNTTMSHIFVGANPKPLSRMPFKPVFTEAQDRTAGELGININSKANVHLLPNIAGHVGSDIVGMIIAAGMDSLQGSHIAIDIGTNGEVVAAKDGRLVCCSTAAGPAFEGATIHQGMRAAPGAIEKVSLAKDGVHLGTIDDAEPVGICGSGLIDAVSELLRVGIVDPSGRMLTKEQATEAGVPDKLAERIVGEGIDAHFVLYYSADSVFDDDKRNKSENNIVSNNTADRNTTEKIILTQADIREVQLAKGAILAGIETLMEELGMTVGDIDSIMLAGAFGNYIDKHSALGIGLLPQVEESRIVAIGNAAGVGACMTLLSESESAHADETAATTEHIELAMNPIFEEYYIDAMRF